MQQQRQQSKQERITKEQEQKQHHRKTTEWQQKQQSNKGNYPNKPQQAEPVLQKENRKDAGSRSNVPTKEDGTKAQNQHEMIKRLQRKLQRKLQRDRYVGNQLKELKQGLQHNEGVHQNLKKKYQHLKKRWGKSKKEQEN